MLSVAEATESLEGHTSRRSCRSRSIDETSGGLPGKCAGSSVAFPKKHQCRRCRSTRRPRIRGHRSRARSRSNGQRKYSRNRCRSRIGRSFHQARGKTFRRQSSHLDVDGIQRHASTPQLRRIGGDLTPMKSSSKGTKCHYDRYSRHKATETQRVPF